MRRAWQIACVAFLGLSILMSILSLEYPYMDRLGPGPAFFPVWLGIITGVLSVALFIQTTWGNSAVSATPFPFPDRKGVSRIMAILIALVGCLILLDLLGFRISLFLFLLFLPLALGVRNWWGTLLFASVGSFGVFHLFYYWLKVILPIGIFGI